MRQTTQTMLYRPPNLNFDTIYFKPATYFGIKTKKPAKKQVFYVTILKN